MNFTQFVEKWEPISILWGGENINLQQRKGSKKMKYCKYIGFIFRCDYEIDNKSVKSEVFVLGMSIQEGRLGGTESRKLW